MILTGPLRCNSLSFSQLNVFCLKFTQPIKCKDTANIFIFHLLSNEIESWGNFPFYMDTVSNMRSVEDNELNYVLEEKTKMKLNKEYKNPYKNNLQQQSHTHTSWQMVK